MMGDSGLQSKPNNINKQRRLTKKSFQRTNAQNEVYVFALKKILVAGSYFFFPSKRIETIV